MQMGSNLKRAVGTGAVSLALFVTSGCSAHYGRAYSAGVVIDYLPHGYVTFHYGGSPHYYYDGYFYRRHRRGYVIVAPPRGVFLRRIPRGARSYRRGGVEYKEYRGVEYERVGKGRNRGYRVKGRRGRRGRR